MNIFLIEDPFMKPFAVGRQSLRKKEIRKLIRKGENAMKYLTFTGLFMLLLLISCTSTPEPAASLKPAVRIHYLGHASFYLRFDNGVSVLTDYGESRAYGLNSPIYDLEGIEPDIVTFSHAHADHKRPDAEFSRTRILTEMDSLSLKGLKITPIRTSEASLSAADNTSYLFTYKGLKILHLADAQAYITAIDQDDIKQKVAALYRDTYDVLLMTIEGVTTFIPQAEVFIDLLQPVRVIPMHYWSPEYKADFLAYLETKNKEDDKHYHIVKAGEAEFSLYADKKASPIQVISLDPASLSQME
jgi:L-ascorbate metabolism protein UlaG (beta-lactamase superfamily)